MARAGRALLLGALACLGALPARSVRLQRVEAGAAAALRASRFGAALGGRTSTSAGNFNCTRFPEACEPPFSCNLPAKKKATKATSDGHGDYSTWCDSLEYLQPAIHCQSGDLRKYGRTMHEAQNAISPIIQMVDAHYCFAFGHCDIFEITPNTTVQEAEAMCDQMFGHEGWTKMKDLQASVFDWRISLTPHLSKRAESEFAKLACAMGNFHCDNVYCKQEFCDKPEWRTRLGSARPSRMKKLHGQDYPRGL